jgi:RNA polymerase sigma-70 factor (ECF subfamily)
MAGFDDFSDAELLRRSKRDAEAFRVIYQRHAGTLFAGLRSELGEAEAAEEITAETFARAWLARGRFRDERAGSALPWLRGIAANLVRANRRGQRVERDARNRLGIDVERGVEDDEYARVDQVDAADRLAGSLAAGLSKLPSAQREALELRAVEERSYREIAATQRTSESLARVRVARGIAKLRRALAGEVRNDV